MFSPALTETDKERLERRGYSLKGVIAEGMNSIVFLMEYRIQQDLSALAEVESTNAVAVIPPKTLACKVVDSAKMPKTIGVKFFLRELDILSKISHPHIIHVHSIIQCSTKFFVFMKYAELGNLCDFILTHGPLKEKHTRGWIRQLVVALIYLHTLDLAHRDVKCENILITANHNIKLTDFGFSRFVVNKKGKEIHSSTFCGSLAYAAPELLRGTRYYPKQVDIWSVGIVFYIMLNGSMPFDSQNIVQMYTDQITKNYRFRTAIKPRVSQHVVDLVEGLLEPEPKQRLSLETVLKSRWMRAVLKYRQLNSDELAALENAKLAKQAFKDISTRQKNRGSFSLLVEERDHSAMSIPNKPMSHEVSLHSLERPQGIEQVSD